MGTKRRRGFGSSGGMCVCSPLRKLSDSNSSGEVSPSRNALLASGPSRD